MLRPQWEKAIAHFIENGDKVKAYDFAGYNTKGGIGSTTRQAEILFSKPKIIERIKELENENHPSKSVAYFCEFVADLKSKTRAENVRFAAVISSGSVYVKRENEVIFKLNHDDAVALRDWLGFVISQQERYKNGSD